VHKQYKEALLMSKQNILNDVGHGHENQILDWVRSKFKELGYSVLGAVKEGHVIAYNEKTGELIQVDQLNADKKAILIKSKFGSGPRI
jgi:hypothetical protein